jgi:hypothetical protein
MLINIFSYFQAHLGQVRSLGCAFRKTSSSIDLGVELGRAKARTAKKFPQIIPGLTPVQPFLPIFAKKSMKQAWLQ